MELETREECPLAHRVIGAAQRKIYSYINALRASEFERVKRRPRGAAGLPRIGTAAARAARRARRCRAPNAPVQSFVVSPTHSAAWALRAPPRRSTRGLRPSRAGGAGTRWGARWRLRARKAHRARGRAAANPSPAAPLVPQLASPPAPAGPPWARRCPLCPPPTRATAHACSAGADTHDTAACVWLVRLNSYSARISNHMSRKQNRHTGS